jgi:hypothetical protein
LRPHRAPEPCWGRVKGKKHKKAYTDCGAEEHHIGVW